MVFPIFLPRNEGGMSKGLRARVFVWEELRRVDDIEGREAEGFAAKPKPRALDRKRDSMILEQRSLLLHCF